MNGFSLSQDEGLSRKEVRQLKREFKAKMEAEEITWDKTFPINEERFEKRLLKDFKGDDSHVLIVLSRDTYYHVNENFILEERMISSNSKMNDDGEFEYAYVVSSPLSKKRRYTSALTFALVLFFLFMSRKHPELTTKSAIWWFGVVVFAFYLNILIPFIFFPYSISSELFMGPKPWWVWPLLVYYLAPIVIYVVEVIREIKLRKESKQFVKF